MRGRCAGWCACSEVVSVCWRGGLHVELLYVECGTVKCVL